MTVKPVVGRGHEQADARRACGTRPVRRERRRGAKADALLGDQRLPVQIDLLAQAASRSASESVEPTLPNCAPPGPAGALLRRADDHAVEVGHARAARLAASPSHQRGASAMQQILAAAGCLAESRQIGAEPAVLRDGRAERVAHQIGRLAAGLHAARTGRRSASASSSSGSAWRPVDAAHDQVDALQALQRLQEDAVAGRAQVAALDQQIAEIAREIGMAEIVVVVRARGQQRDARVAALGERVRLACRRWKNGASRMALQASKMSPATCVCTTRLASA